MANDVISKLAEYVPLYKQQEFHDSPAKYRAFIGGFGSGKSKAIIMEAIQLGIEMPNNRILIGRATYPELESTTKLDFFEALPEELIRHRNDTKNYVELVNGTIYFFRALDKPDKFKSLNLGAFVIDEASEVDENIFFMLQSRLRYGAVPRTCGILATNYEGHNWIWRLFVNKSAEEEKKNMLGTKYKPDLYAYFESPTTDNTHLPDDYVDTLLQSFNDNWIRRYVYGSFEEFDGLVYYAFNPSKHIYQHHKITKEEAVIDAELDFVEDAGKVIVAIDPGVAITAVLFGFYRYRDKKLFLFAEIYKSRQDVREISILIKQILTAFKIRKPLFIIDPSSIRKEQTSKSSVINDFRKEGINPKLANNDLNFGMLRVNSMFKNDNILIYKKLKNLFDEITDYYLDDRTGKPKGNQADHLCDVLRYICTSLSSSEVSAKSKEEEIADIRERRKGLRMYRKKSVKNMKNFLTNHK